MHRFLALFLAFVAQWDTIMAHVEQHNAPGTQAYQAQACYLQCSNYLICKKPKDECKRQFAHVLQACGGCRLDL